MKSIYSFIYILLVMILSTHVFAGNISGEVKYNGEQIAGAHVSALGYTENGDSLFAETVSGLEGDFGFASLAKGTYYIRAVLDSLISDQQGPFEIDESTVVTNVTLELYDPCADCGSISGIVKTDDDTPIAYVRLTLGLSGNTYASDYTYSDMNGNFMFLDIHPGEYHLTAYHPLGFVKDYDPEISVNEKQHIENVEVIFTKDDLAYGSLTGFVKTEFDEPVENAVVQAAYYHYKGDVTDSSLVVFTDASGQYVFNEMIPADYIISSFHPSGHYKQLAEPVTVTGNQQTDAPDIVFNEEETQLGTVSGKVVFGDDDIGVKNAKITFWPVQVDSFFYTNFARTDSAGNYKTDLGTGSYIVFCEYTDSENNNYLQYYDHTEEWSNATPVQVSADQTTSGINFNFQSSELLSEVDIGGRVINDQGTALVSAKISLFPGRFGVIDTSIIPILTTYTNVYGTYNFKLFNVNPLNTQCYISAEADNYIREFYNDKKEFFKADPIKINNSSVTGIDFTLDAVSDSDNIISGLITNTNLEPVKDVEITAYKVGNMSDIISTRSSDDGIYTLKGQGDGDYVIQYYSPGYNPEFYNNQVDWQKAVRFSGHQSYFNVDVKLTEQAEDTDSKGTIAGQVMDEENNRLEGVLVTLENTSGEILSCDFTDKDGLYNLNRSLQGDLNVRVNRVNFTPQLGEYSFPENAPQLLVRNFVLKSNVVSSLPGSDEKKYSPDRVTLFGNSPNPFNPLTRIKYHLAKQAFVNIIVYDINGRFVTGLKNESQTQGNHTAVWNGLDKNGTHSASGIYFYRIKVIFPNNKQTIKGGKMILIK